MPSETTKLFGIQIPLPETDLYASLALVLGFLPFVVIVHWTLAALFGKKKSH